MLVYLIVNHVKIQPIVTLAIVVIEYYEIKMDVYLIAILRKQYFKKKNFT